MIRASKKFRDAVLILEEEENIFPLAMHIMSEWRISMHWLVDRIILDSTNVISFFGAKALSETMLFYC